MTTYLFTYPSNREAHDRMLDDLQRCLEECHVEASLGQVLSLTVSEAFTNAVIHGNREDRSKSITVRLQVNENQIIADIVDQGSGGTRKIESRKPSTSYDESGRGIDLIRHFSDSCQFTETATGGVQVSILFRRCREKEHKT